MNYENQVVIITGGTRGIGRGITEEFLKAGATVIATYAGNTTAAESFKETNEHKERLKLAKFDVSDSKACSDFFENITKDYEQIHVLINNAGIRQDALGASMSEDQWDQVML